MAKLNGQNIILVSGPCGVGKSTITKLLAQELKRTVLIEGDVIADMFKGKQQLDWDSILRLTWETIVTLTKNFINNDFDVIIDYVVEEEWEWFCQQLEDSKVNIHYVVLRADESVLKERIQDRGDVELIDRSLFLLNKLENKPENMNRLYDTSNKHPDDILQDLKTRFDVN